MIRLRDPEVSPTTACTSGSASADAKSALGLSVGLGVAALAWDPLAPAALPKRVLVIAVAVVGLAVALGQILRGDAARRLWPPSALALIALAVWTALSLAWGNASGVDEVGGVAALALCSALAATQRVEVAQRAAKQLATAVGAVTTLVILVQAALGTALHGGHGNSNRAGLVLGIALFPALGLATQRWRARGSVKAWVGLGVGLAAWIAALWMTESRTTWAALVVGGLTAWATARGQTGRGVGLLTSAPFIIALGLSVLAAPMASALPAEAAESLAGRGWLWDAAGTAALEHLPFGAGAGDFSSAFLEAQASQLAPLSVDAAAERYHFIEDAHNEGLHALVVGGPMSLLLLVGAIGWALHDRVRGRDPWLSAALATTVVAAAGDGALHRPAVAVIVGLIVGATTRRVPLPRWGPVAWFALGVGVTWLLQVEVRSWVAARAVAESRHLLPVERLVRVEWAANLAPHSARVTHELGLARSEVGDHAGAIAALLRARTLGMGPLALVALGNAHVQQGEHERAERSYRRALALHPGSFRARANLASVLTTRGELTAASKELALARELYPHHPKVVEIAERLRRAQLDAAANAATSDP